MSEHDRGGKPPSDEDRSPGRDDVMDALCDAYARDELEIEELERRLDLAARGASSGELMDLVADLDRRNLPVALGGMAAAPTDGQGPRTPERQGASEPAGSSGALRVPPGGGRIDPARVPNRQIEIAFLSGRVRKGSWTPGRRITATAFMGGVELDFREALFGSEAVEIHAAVLMGSVEILVPPGVHVDAAGFALLGAFEEDSSLETAPEPRGPTIRVRGFACMGSVEVIVRHPGESARDAKRRRKQESRKRLESGGG